MQFCIAFTKMYQHEHNKKYPSRGAGVFAIGFLSDRLLFATHLCIGSGGRAGIINHITEPRRQAYHGLLTAIVTCSFLGRRLF